MRPTKYPSTSLGRTEHVIALLVTPDAVAFEVAVASQLFGRRIPALAAVTGDADSPYWVLAPEFRAAHPLARLEAEKLYLDDGSVHTSGGMFSVVDLCLHLMALDLGQAYANDVGRLLVSAPHRPGGHSSSRSPSGSTNRRWVGCRSGSESTCTNR